VFSVSVVILLKFQTIVILHVNILFSLVTLIIREEVFGLDILNVETQFKFDFLFLLLFHNLLLSFHIILLFNLLHLFNLVLIVGHLSQIKFLNNFLIDLFIQGLFGSIPGFLLLTNYDCNEISI